LKRISSPFSFRAKTLIFELTQGLNGAKIRRIIGDFAPKGLQDSAQGFNQVLTLGTLKINEFALKGREADQIRLLRK
jgi:hypothetical protein